MSVLRAIESKLESLFEGVFGRAFRTNVQPVELARKLVKEMDDHKNVSVSRVYVPNEYTVYLSVGDAWPGATMIYTPETPAPQPTEAASPIDLGVEEEVAVFTWDGQRHEVA